MLIPIGVPEHPNATIYEDTMIIRTKKVEKKLTSRSVKSGLEKTAFSKWLDQGSF